MSGIYIHIPFCRKACSYCDFHFSTSLKQKDRVINGLMKEIEMRKESFPKQVNTLYFGGGTPSILESREIELILESIAKVTNIKAALEVTLEANPEDISTDKLKSWKSAGINRLSIGTQSFINRDLELMNRAHSGEDAISAVKRAQDVGFENITIDLIYGIPGQSENEWLKNIEQAIVLETTHLSSYCLTIEPRTALAHAIEKGKIREKEETLIEAEFLQLHDRLSDAGFNHYEISNFAKPGLEALHNSSYWSGEAYIGIGPSAHSFDGLNERCWNVANNMKYLQAIESGTIDCECEKLSESERFNEQLMTALRTAKGLEMQAIIDAHIPAFSENIESLSGEMKSWLEPDTSHLRMQPKHWLKCDALIRELMID